MTITQRLREDMRDAEFQLMLAATDAALLEDATGRRGVR